MYCVKCGVELGEGERKCPLCLTPVYFPDLPEPERAYPEFVNSKEEISTRGIYFILSMLMVIAAVISVVCDVTLYSSIVWSGYAVCGIALVYVIFVLPVWFIHRSPAIFLPLDFIAVGAYLLYVSLKTEGGWFLSFAFPIVGGVALIVCTVVILIYYLRCGRLYIFGGASIALAAFTVLIEFLIHLNFGITHSSLFIWSLYPSLSLFLIGVMLIVIAIVKPFKESLKKIFAL